MKRRLEAGLLDTVFVWGHLKRMLMAALLDSAFLRNDIKYGCWKLGLLEGVSCEEEKLEDIKTTLQQEAGMSFELLR